MQYIVLCNNFGGAHLGFARCQLECLVMDILMLRIIHSSRIFLIKWRIMPNKFPSPWCIDLKLNDVMRWWLKKLQKFGNFYNFNKRWICNNIGSYKGKWHYTWKQQHDFKSCNGKCMRWRCTSLTFLKGSTQM